MEKADFLNYRLLVREVQQLKGQLMALESSLYSPKGQRFTSTPHATSGKGKTMEDAVAGHIRLVEHYEAQLAEKEAQQLAIEQAIASLKDAAQRQVMRDRYISGLSWGRILSDFAQRGYSERQVYRLHGYALLNLKEF